MQTARLSFVNCIKGRSEDAQFCLWIKMCYGLDLIPGNRSFKIFSHHLRDKNDTTDLTWYAIYKLWSIRENRKWDYRWTTCKCNLVLSIPAKPHSPVISNRFKNKIITVERRVSKFSTSSRSITSSNPPRSVNGTVHKSSTWFCITQHALLALTGC